jgi:hypothetical protein
VAEALDHESECNIACDKSQRTGERRPAQAEIKYQGPLESLAPTVAGAASYGGHGSLRPLSLLLLPLLLRAVPHHRRVIDGCHLYASFLVDGERRWVLEENA